MIIQIEPWIDEEESKQLKEVINSTFVTEWKKTEEFQKKFKELTKAKYALAYCNGTMSLFAALKILGIGNGDEVIVPDLTFIASSNSIILSGADPVFVDVDKDTFQIDPSEIEKAITSKTKAIMPVHLYGQSCEMDAIMDLAKKYNLRIIEDAAQGVGVKYKGKHVGTFGEFGSFSFYGNKTITTGEGGMLITSDENLSKRAFSFKNHGRAKKGVFIHEEIGYNFSITEMQAAVGIAQLSKLDRIKSKKEEIRKIYEKGLSDIQEVKLSFIDPRCSVVNWFTNIIVPDAGKLQDYLMKKGIQTRRAFYPLHLQPCYNYMKSDKKYPNADYVYEHMLSLPSSYKLAKNEIEQVIEGIKEFYKK